MLSVCKPVFIYLEIFLWVPFWVALLSQILLNSSPIFFSTSTFAPLLPNLSRVPSLLAFQSSLSYIWNVEYLRTFQLESWTPFSRAFGLIKLRRTNEDRGAMKYARSWVDKEKNKGAKNLRGETLKTLQVSIDICLTHSIPNSQRFTRISRKDSSLPLRIIHELLSTDSTELNRSLGKWELSKGTGED